MNLSKHTLLSLMFLFSGFVFPQNSTTIQGNISGKKIAKDTINFSSGILNKKYYDIDILSSEIKNNNFLIKTDISYPHMFVISLNSEKNNILFREGVCFIDKSTKTIKLDSVYKIKNIDGLSNLEFKNKFIPYILKNKKENLFIFCFNNRKLFDTRLLNYVIKNPDSYVALWFLIERVNTERNVEQYEKILNSFSVKMKKEKLWKVLHDEFKLIKIHDNEKFPEFELKNIDLKKEKIELQNSRFLLIDFWFSRCKPCLEQIPKFKYIYDNYKTKKFEIISISVDKTAFIDKWKKRIVEFDMQWKNYLDENAVIANNEKIFSFPTNFLLNEEGEIIRKNIEPDDLEKFLKENL
jgi:peroxiredoxin